jgi:hypothetical protein
MSAPRSDLATRINRDIGQNASFIGERPQVGSRRTDPVDRAPATLQPSPYVIAAPRLFPLFAFGRNPFGEVGSVGCANFSAGSAFASAIAADPLTPIDCSREIYPNGGDALTPLVPGRSPDALYGRGYTPNPNILQ